MARRIWHTFANISSFNIYVSSLTPARCPYVDRRKFDDIYFYFTHTHTFSIQGNSEKISITYAV